MYADRLVCHRCVTKQPTYLDISFHYFTKTYLGEGRGLQADPFSMVQQREQESARFRRAKGVKILNVVA